MENLPAPRNEAALKFIELSADELELLKMPIEVNIVGDECEEFSLNAGAPNYMHLIK